MVVYDTARQLAEELKSSDEYRAYAAARETAMANETTRALVAEYHSALIVFSVTDAVPYVAVER